MLQEAITIPQLSRNIQIYPSLRIEQSSTYTFSVNICEMVEEILSEV